MEKKGASLTVPLVHVGYPKTGSTWLQETFFSREDCGFLRIPMFDVLEALVFRDAIDFDVDAASRAFAPYLQGAGNRGLVPVISNEVLIGDQTQGRYWGVMVAERLRQVLANAKVLIVVREQAAMILSAYRQHVRVGGRSSMAAFISREPGFDAYCRMDFLEYDRMVIRYQDLFGAENVLVLPFEMMCRSLGEFSTRVLDFAGVPARTEPEADVINAGFGAATLELRRRLNLLLGGWTYFDGPRPPWGHTFGELACKALDRILPRVVQRSQEGRIGEVAAKAVGRRFAESNRRTGELIGIDLASYGYPCAGTGPTQEA